MQGKRHSRGNVAVAALLFVTFVGVAAVALDSVRITYTPTAQLAQAAKKEESKKTKCEYGFDYNLKINTKNSQPTVEKRGNNQCVLGNGVTAPTSKEQATATGRSCQPKEAWRCQVWYCKPDALRLKAGGKFKDRKDETEGCTLIRNKSLKVGEEIDTNESSVASEVSQQTGSALSEILRNGTTEEKKAAAPYLQALDSTQSTRILGAFEKETADTLRYQEELVEDRKMQRDIAKTKYDECMSGVWYDLLGKCADAQKAVSATDEEVKKQEQKLADLRKQAQELNKVKDVLQPTNRPDASAAPPDRQGNPRPPTTFPDGPPGGSPPPNSSGGGMGDIMKTLGQFAPLIGQLLNGALGGQKPPTCTLKASPANITRAGQPVTLSWTTQNAQQAYLSASGQVGPTGQMTVNPQQTTSYTMQVTGYPQQQAQQQQQQQPQGQFVYNPYTGQYQFVQAQQQQQQPQGQGAPQQGQCQVQVTLGQGSGGDDDKGSGDKPKAQISCQPKIADVGMSVSISYACQNSTASKGEGFSTSDKLSGSASADVKSPEKGSTTVKYGLTCTKESATDSAECTVNVNKPSIVLVANPKDIEEGEKTTIGWVTGAMESCIVSSPDLSEFTEANKSNTSTSGSAKTPPLEKDTKFVLTCTTKAGGTKTAETTVQVED